jgi:plastocyanin
MSIRPITASLGALLFALATGTARAEVVEIRMKQVGFAPAQISAHVGDTIAWINDDIVAHTATARNGAWDVMIPPHGRKETVIKSSGAFPYYCKLHPNMVGEINVAE